MVIITVIRCSGEEGVIGKVSPRIIEAIHSVFPSARVDKRDEEAKMTVWICHPSSRFNPTLFIEIHPSRESDRSRGDIGYSRLTLDLLRETIKKLTTTFRSMGDLQRKLVRIRKVLKRTAEKISRGCS